jgi:hypothetical protein
LDPQPVPKVTVRTVTNAAAATGRINNGLYRVGWTGTTRINCAWSKIASVASARFYTQPTVARFAAWGHVLTNKI